jgi:hypothetical protein
MSACHIKTENWKRAIETAEKVNLLPEFIEYPGFIINPSIILLPFVI